MDIPNGDQQQFALEPGARIRFEQRSDIAIRVVVRSRDTGTVVTSILHPGAEFSIECGTDGLDITLQGDVDYPGPGLVDTSID